VPSGCEDARGALSRHAGSHHGQPGVVVTTAACAQSDVPEAPVIVIRERTYLYHVTPTSGHDPPFCPDRTGTALGSLAPAPRHCCLTRIPASPGYARARGHTPALLVRLIRRPRRFRAEFPFWERPARARPARSGTTVPGSERAADDGSGISPRFANSSSPFFGDRLPTAMVAPTVTTTSIGQRLSQLPTSNVLAGLDLAICASG
jgi:hypothetical protein